MQNFNVNLDIMLLSEMSTRISSKQQRWGGVFKEYSLKTGHIYMYDVYYGFKDLCWICLFALSRTSNLSAIWRLSPLQVTGLQI
jgi:hypothetical protein